MTKAAVIIGAILLLAGVATAGTLTGLGSSGDSPTVSVPSLGTTTNDDSPTASVPAQGTTTNGEDVSGPCDEAEHAGDPRCTGTGTLEDDDRGDRRGRGRDDDDDRAEDRSGPSENSGPGSVNSGRDDDGGDDHGGNSGRGGGDDD